MYMKEENKNSKKFKFPNIVGYLIFVFLFLIFFSSALYFTKRDVLDKVIASISYKEEEDIAYRVHYKENPYYTEDYLPEGKTYIANLVDIIDMDFSYLVKYADKIAGSYDYSIRAKLVAYAPGNRDEDLWSREYEILQEELIEFNDDSSYSIDKSFSINYQRYKDEYDNYREGTSISSEGILLIELLVKNSGKYEELDKFNYESFLRLEIPVSDETFKIKNVTNITEDEKTISKYESANVEQTLVIIIAALLWILTILTVVSGICYANVNRKKLSFYEKRLRKILANYDSIIVNVENLPSLTGLNVVDVTTFEELIDAQNEIRLPINFSENKKKRIAKFVIVADNLAWVYTLKEGETK